MIKISLKQLQTMGACEDGVKWFTGQRARTLKRIVPKLIEGGHADYAFWLLPRFMTHPQKVSFAIYAAEQVLAIFETAHPTDDRPRKAIQAAKDFLAGKITADAVYAAAYAADAAVYAADAAANAAADAAANAATYAADAAGRRAMKMKIANYGLTLLGEGGKHNGK